MKRREFITLVAGTVALPSAARAQQAAMPVIGWLNSTSLQAEQSVVAAFRRGLAEVGIVEGQNATIEFRWADGHYERLPELAADLVRRRVAVIATTSGLPPVLAAKAATSTIPIVFTVGGDPIQFGLVSSLSRPGGNITGISVLNVELAPKRLELLHELVPVATAMALLVNSANPNADTQLKEVQAAALALGIELHILHASNDRDLEAVLASLDQIRVGGLIIGADIFFVSRVEQIAAAALRHAVPTIFQYRDFAVAGGLMSYGGDNIEVLRLAGVYAGKIVKGAKPADLPVQQSAKVELIINLKTAKALGVPVPLALLTRADEVIE